MANFKTLIVYVLALVICSSSFVSTSTVPIVPKDASFGSSSSQQKSQQLPNFRSLEHQQRPQYHRQKVEEKLQVTPDPPLTPESPSVPHQTAPDAPTTYSIKNGFGFSAGNSRSGPYTNGYGYVSGRTLQSQPEQVYMTDYDLMEQQRPNRLTDITAFTGFPEALSQLFGHNLDFKQIFGGMLLGYGSTLMGVPGKFSGFFPTVTRVFRYFWDDPEPTLKEAKKGEPEKRKDEEKEVKELVQLGKKEPAASNSTTTSKRRRKRDVEIDTDLTELATMVLAAIKSGECMQRSICLLGSQIGASSRGRAAFTLVDKLVPESVQGNQYFVTLKKALRGGESFCDRFHCRLN